MQSRFYQAGWKLIDILFPPCCAGCGEWGERYCQACFKNTRKINSVVCEICGEPGRASRDSLCVRCKEEKPFYTAVRSWALFEEPLKGAIHKLKYHRNIGLGEVLAVPLFEVLADCDWDINLITAVPLDRARQLERGFNQCELLARPLGWFSNIPYNAKAIKRSRITRSQVGLSRAERKSNLADAFIANSEIVEGKSILIVDDVITTGSTLNACSKSLIESGADRVYGVTLARSAHL